MQSLKRKRVGKPTPTKKNVYLPGGEQVHPYEKGEFTRPYGTALMIWKCQKYYEKMKIKKVVR